MNSEQFNDRWSDRLTERGFTSFLDFAKQRPCSTYRELANEIGGPQMAPADVFQLLKNEVVTPDDFHYLLVSTLARLIRKMVTDAARKNVRVKFAFTNACSAWVSLFDVKHQVSCLNVIKNLQAQNHRFGWVPTSTDDLELARAFEGVTFKA